MICCSMKGGEQGRNFAINMECLSLKKDDMMKTFNNLIMPLAAIKWFEAKLNEEIDINDHFNKYRVSEALMSVINWWTTFVHGIWK